MSEDADLLGRWAAATRAAGLRGDDGTALSILRAYGQRHRHYHSRAHLVACLRELDSARSLARSESEVEIALWFHDAVYRTWSGRNEANSAAWAARFIRDNGGSEDVVGSVVAMIHATRHSVEELTGDRALVSDIDLSILGQPETTFDQFESNVRLEYWWVPLSMYRRARMRILESFLARTTIYHFAAFQQRYESSARRNIERVLKQSAVSVG